MVRELKTKPTDYTITFLTDDEPVRINMGTSYQQAFRKAAEIEAFSDCTDVHNVRVHHNGRTYRYAGWAPGMEIAFVNETGVTVYCGWFPNWDH